MKKTLVAFLSTIACAGVLQANAETTITATPYNFDSINVTGEADAAGTLEVWNGTTKVEEQAIASGAYTVDVTGLTTGNVYKCKVVVGTETVAAKDVTLANQTATLFGATATSTPVNGTWDTAPAVESGVYKFQGSSSKFTVTDTPDGKIVYIDSDMTFADGADELDETLEALGAFTLAQTNDVGEAEYFWAGLTGGTTKWVALEGVTAVADCSYVSRMEFDFNANPALVRYLVKVAGGTDFVALHDANGNEWFTANSSATSVASVSYEGTGSLTSLAGSSIDTAVATYGTTDYSTIKAALNASKTPAGDNMVTLKTNVKVTPDEDLNGNKWQMIAGDYDLQRVEVTGYDSTYENGVLSIFTFQPSVKVAGSSAIGCDFTNGTINVSLTDAKIQSGAPVSVTVTVKDASGTQVGTETFSDITGATEQSYVIPAELTRKGDYTYEVVVKDSEQNVIAQDAGSFMAANDATWFTANSTHGWNADGSWKSNNVEVTVSGDALALGGAQYDFTPTRAGNTNAIVRVDTVIEITGPIDSEELPEDENAQGMIALAETSAEVATPVWKAYVGGEWVDLTGGETGNGTYTIRAEFDYRVGVKKIRYSVKKDGAAFAVLKLNGEDWIANNKSDATTLAGASAMGVGNLYSLNGDNIDAFVAQVGDNKYETMAEALAAGGPVTLLWDCTWTAGLNGQWTISRNKNLTIYGADGWDVDYTDGTLQASNVKVAQVGETDYCLLKKAFAAVPANGTVIKMLTNLVQNVDVAVANSADLDLAGWFVSGAGALVPAENQTLIFTNSTDVAGGFNMGVNGSYLIKGGKWATNEDPFVAPNYKLFALAVWETVDGVTYAYEAKATTVAPSEAKVYPVVGGGEAVVTNGFVETYIKAGKTMSDAEVAAALNNATGVANGLPPIQSYILGLIPTDAASKPVVKSEQNADSDKLVLNLGLNVNAAAGVPVTFVLKEASEAGAAGEAKASNDTGRFEIDLNATGSALKYYSVDIKFGK